MQLRVGHRYIELGLSPLVKSTAITSWFETYTSTAVPGILYYNTWCMYIYRIFDIGWTRLGRGYLIYRIQIPGIMPLSRTYYSSSCRIEARVVPRLQQHKFKLGCVLLLYLNGRYLFLCANTYFTAVLLHRIIHIESVPTTVCTRCGVQVRLVPSKSTSEGGGVSSVLTTAVSQSSTAAVHM